MTNGTDSPRLHTTWHTGSVTAGPLISRKIKIRRSQHPDLKRMPRTSKQVARLSDLATNKNEPPKKDTKNRKKKRKRKRKGRKKRKKKKGKKRTYKGFKKNKASKNEPPCVLQWQLFTSNAANQKLFWSPIYSRPISFHNIFAHNTLTRVSHIRNYLYCKQQKALRSPINEQNLQDSYNFYTYRTGTKVWLTKQEDKSTAKHSAYNNKTPKHLQV